MRKTFPGRNYSLDLRLESWNPKPYYQAYLQGKDDEEYTFSANSDTPNEAVESLIQKRKEVLKAKEAKAN